MICIALRHAQPQFARRPQRRPPRCAQCPRQTRPASQSASCANPRPGSICPAARRASSLSTWWQMPRPTSKKLRMPCSATKWRISAWFCACLVVGAGTAWSSVIASRSGMQHAFLAKLLPDAANGGGVVVAQHYIGPRIDHLAHCDVVQPRRTRQRLLRKGLGPVIIVGALTDKRHSRLLVKHAERIVPVVAKRRDEMVTALFIQRRAGCELTPVSKRQRA